MRNLLPFKEETLILLKNISPPPGCLYDSVKKTMGKQRRATLPIHSCSGGRPGSHTTSDMVTLLAEPTECWLLRLARTTRSHSSCETAMATSGIPHATLSESRQDSHPWTPFLCNSRKGRHLHGASSSCYVLFRPTSFYLVIVSRVTG